MINLRATRIDQTFNLQDGGVQNFLVVELPDGTELKAPINEAQTEQIIAASVNGEEYEAPPEPAVGGWTTQQEQAYERTYEQAPTPPIQKVGEQSDEQDAANAQALFESLQEEPVDEGKLINWGSLPNEMLTVTMKAAFKMLGAPPQMSFEDIQKLANNVAEQFGPEDWAQVQQQVQRAAPRPAPRRAPPINQVQWADGSPMVAGTVPARTIPKDDMGNPIVEGEVDPGEVVAAGDQDEDGVASL